MFALRSLLLAPWWRGPLMLVRQPSVAFALVIAASVAALPVAAAPLFLSSAANATLHSRIDSTCPADLGLQTSATDLGSPEFMRATANAADREANAVAGIHSLGPARTTVVAKDFNVRFGTEANAAVTSVARADAAAHLKLLSGRFDDGAWIPDRLAARLGVQVGDRMTVLPNENVTITRPDGHGNWVTVQAKPASMPVTAIYQDLRDLPETQYWCGVSSIYRGAATRNPNSPAPPDVVMMGPKTLIALSESENLAIEVRLERAVQTDGLTLPAADRLAAALTGARRDMDQIYHSDGHLRDMTAPPPLLPPIAARTDLIAGNLRSTTLPMTIAGLLVGLTVVAAAGVFWVRRRRRELIVLATHGATPGSLGLKASMEAAPALVIGTALGWVIAPILVGSIGPTSLITHGATRQSLILCAGAFGIALVVESLVAVAACRGLIGLRRPSSRSLRPLRRLPWELAAFGVAGLVWTHGSSLNVVTFKDGLGSVAQVPARVLVVPMLVIVGVVGLCARLGRHTLRARPNRPIGSSAVRLLVARRFQHFAVGAVTLTVISAVPVAFALYGSTATDSVKATLAAQARSRLGSDVVITLSRPAPIPAALSGLATAVKRLDWVQLGSFTTSLLVIDPTTFARIAYWDDRINDESMTTTIRGLRASTHPGSPVTVAASAPVASGAQELSFLDMPPITVRVRALAALPAERGGMPVALMDRSVAASLGDGPTSIFASADNEIWAHGDPVEIHRAALAAGLPIAAFAAADHAYEGTYYQPVTYTFAFLTALSLLMGAVVTVGYLLYLESRMPSYRRGFIMLRHMGLRGHAHLAAMAVEICAPVLLGLMLGLSFALALVTPLAAYFNLDRDQPPATVISVPMPLIVGMIITCLIFISATVCAAHARIARSRAGEVLREVG